MKVLQVASGLLVLAVLQSVHGDYRYKLRGPPPPPPKPLPPRPPLAHFSTKPFPQAQFFNTKAKWPLLPAANNGHRVISPMRGSHFQHQQFHHPMPQLHQHYVWNGPHHAMPLSLHGGRPQFQFKGPTLLLSGSGTSLPAWKGDANLLNHGFRAPALKEQFLPSPPSEYQPPKVSVSLPLPQPPVISHIGNAIDDDKGPIHTIPAPNLSPSSNPHQNHQLLQQVFPQTQVTVQQSHGYEVREPSNDQAGHTPEGVPTYYAPDPDPSLPAPKIPATTDPHSLPSNGKTPIDLQPGLQILDHNGNLANSLSSQELFQLLHTPQQQQPPQQPLVDSYGVPLVQQPQLQQHFHQQAALFPPSNFLKQAPSEQAPDDSLVLKTIRDEFNPDYQSFNYEEQYQGSSHRHQQEDYSQSYQEQEGSENVPSVTVVRKSPESTITSFQGHFETQNDYEPKSNSVVEEDAYYDNTPSNAESNSQEDYEESNNDVNQNEAKSPTTYYSQIDEGNGAISSSFYTTLPNREAAETLATLAAAGNINSNLVNHIRNEEKENTTPVREVEEEEEYEDEEDSEEPPPPQITKPINTPRPREPEVTQTTRNPSTYRHHVHRRPVVTPPPPPPLKNVQEDSEYTDYADQESQDTKSTVKGVISHTEPTYQDKKKEQKEDTKPVNTNVQFGARIRPKRNK